MSDQPTDRLLKVRDVAARCEVSTQAVYAWIKDKGLPTVRLGITLRIRESELEAWIERERPASQGAA